MYLYTTNFPLPWNDRHVSIEKIPGARDATRLEPLPLSSLPLLSPSLSGVRVVTVVRGGVVVKRWVSA